MIVLVNGRFEGPYSDALGIGYLASALRKVDIHTELIDPVVERMSIIQCAKAVAALKPAMVGISILSIEYRQEVIEFANILRQELPLVHISVGGRDPSLSYAQYLSATKAIDSVSLGEGELSVVELAQRILSGDEWRNIDGLCYASEGEIIRNFPARRIEDINKIPFPARDTLKKYLADRKVKRVQILGARGCYSNCTFCTSPSFDRIHTGSRLRFRDVPNIIVEMNYIYDTFGISHFDFVDDVFVLPGDKGLERAREFKELLKDNPRSFTFNVQLRADTVQRQVIEDLKSVGLNEVFIGIENFEDDSLDIYNKKCDFRMYDNALKCLQTVGFSANICADYRIRMGMLTFHAEATLNTLKAQLEAAKLWGLSPKRLRGRVIPFEGTEITRKYAEKGLLAGTPFKPEFIFENREVELFYGIWKNFIDKLSNLRDKVRASQKHYQGIEDAVSKRMLDTVIYFDNLGMEVFERLLEMIAAGMEETEIDSFIKAKEAEYEAYWANEREAGII